VLHIFLAENIKPGNHAREEGEEEMEIIELSLSEAEEKIRSGEIADAKTIAGIYMYKNQL
jgi:ADP-ribose pyrophosphatase